MSNRLNFIISTLYKTVGRQLKNCPYCNSPNTVKLQRKKILLELRRCQDCHLMYRYPKDELKNNINFYQTEYQEGSTTKLPLQDELSNLLAHNFKGQSIDMSKNIDIVKKYLQTGKLLDYGCSWGYGVYQFARAGYEAIGFEISRPRVLYGRHHLSVNILDSIKSLEELPPNSFDIIHTSHVLEHLSDLREAFQIFQRLIKSTGLLIILVPNAGGKKAQQLGVHWGPMIGEKHTVALDANFLAHSLPRYGFSPMFNSSPYETPTMPYKSGTQVGVDLQGDELLVVARPVVKDIV